jgi:hypothetical protein
MRDYCDAMGYKRLRRLTVLVSAMLTGAACQALAAAAQLTDCDMATVDPRTISSGAR